MTTQAKTVEDKLLELTKEYNNAKLMLLDYRYSDEFVEDGIKHDALFSIMEMAKKELDEFRIEHALGKV